MMHKAWQSIGEVSYCFSMSSIKFQGHTSWEINDLNPISVRLLGWSQLSNPSDLPCFSRTMNCFPFCWLLVYVLVTACHILDGCSLHTGGNERAETGKTNLWRHHEWDGVSNHQPHDCLLNHLFEAQIKENIKAPRHRSLSGGNSPVTGEFPTQCPVTRKMFPLMTSSWI